MSSKNVTVDSKQAEKILRQAIKKVKSSTKNLTKTQWDDEIRNIINGKHKTFRYILITALLAKATNAKTNPLALQAGANIKGAYDARSLCHSVLVPLESELLDHSLGGSNEPFLNKPARFKTISISNPVRAGKDRELLKILYKILSEIKTSKDARNSLCIALKCALEKSTIQNQALTGILNSTDAHLKIIEFIEIFVNKSIEGQVAAIITGTILSLQFDNLDNFQVITHPVNQSGASSKEIADIDIKRNGDNFIVLEIKDKIFSKRDVEHSAIKAGKYGLKSIIFVVGKNGDCNNKPLEQIAKEILDKTKVNVIFTDIISFTKSIVALCPAISFETFLEKLNSCAKKARVKEEVLEHIKDCLESVQTEPK